MTGVRSNWLKTQKVVIAVLVCDPTRFKPHGLPMPDPIWTKDDVLSHHSPSESGLVPNSNPSLCVPSLLLSLHLVLS